MSPRSVVLAVTLALSVSASAACTREEDERPACDPNAPRATTEPAPVGAASFTAFAQNFAGYHGWTSMPAVSSHSGDNGVHGDTPMTVYINRLPPHGSGEFPVGTVIVKESIGGDVRDRTIFAMVKRGGAYNATGAKGWEWFELDGQCSDEPIIAWRGVGPPATETYGGDANGCNPCHANQADNDFVRTDGLALTGF